MVQQMPSRVLSAAFLSGTLVLAGCSGGGTTAPAAQSSPSPSWQPLMAAPSTDPVPEATAEALQDELDTRLAEAGEAADTKRWGYLLYGGFLLESSLVAQ